MVPPGLQGALWRGPGHLSSGTMVDTASRRDGEGAPLRTHGQPIPVPLCIAKGAVACSRDLRVASWEGRDEQSSRVVDETYQKLLSCRWNHGVSRPGRGCRALMSQKLGSAATRLLHSSCCTQPGKLALWDRVQSGSFPLRHPNRWQGSFLGEVRCNEKDSTHGRRKQKIEPHSGAEFFPQ